MIPGCRAPAASIVAAMCSGPTQRAAAEFSFFLQSRPCSARSSTDLYKNRGDMTADHL